MRLVSNLRQAAPDQCPHLSQWAIFILPLVVPTLEDSTLVDPTHAVELRLLAGILQDLAGEVLVLVAPVAPVVLLGVHPPIPMRATGDRAT